METIHSHNGPNYLTLERGMGYLIQVHTKAVGAELYRVLTATETAGFYSLTLAKEFVDARFKVERALASTLKTLDLYEDESPMHLVDIKREEALDVLISDALGRVELAA